MKKIRFLLGFLLLAAGILGLNIQPGAEAYTDEAIIIEDESSPEEGALQNDDEVPSPGSLDIEVNIQTEASNTSDQDYELSHAESSGYYYVEYIAAKTTSIALNTGEVDLDSLQIGDTFTVYATVTTNEDSSSVIPLTWSVSDGNGMESDGLKILSEDDYSLTLNVVKSGTYIITSTTKNDKSDSLEFTVPVPQSTVSISSISDTITTGDTFTIQAVIKNTEDYSYAVPVSWSVTDKTGLELDSTSAVSAVNSSGTEATVSITATAKKSGEYTIKAKTFDGASDSLRISVKAPQSAITLDSVEGPVIVGDVFTIYGTVSNAESYSYAFDLDWSVSDVSGLELSVPEVIYIVSSDETEATVGISVEALKAGTYTVTAVTADKSSASVEIEVTYDFAVPGDEWSFRNYSVDSIPLTDADYTALLSYFTSDSDIAALNDIINEEHGGQCYGFAVSSVLVANDALSLGTVSSSISQLYDAPEDVASKSVIGYYYINQFTTLAYNSQKSFFGKTVQEQLSTIASMTDPFVFCFGGTSIKGIDWAHAIVGYGVEKGSWTTDSGIQYSYRLVTYDSNYPYSSSKREGSYFYFNMDSGEWEIPNYVASYRCTSQDANAYLLMACSDSAVLNCLDLSQGRESAQLIIEVETGSPSLTVNGEKTYSNITPTASDSTVQISVPIGLLPDSEDNSSTYIIEIEDVSSCMLDSANSDDSLDVSILYDGVYLYAEADSYENVTLEADSSISLSGGEGVYTLGITVDESPLDASTIEISGENSSEITLEVSTEGFLVSGNNLTDLTVMVSNSGTVEDTIRISSEEESLLVVNDENGDLVAYVDADDNGTYETPLEDGAGHLVLGDDGIYRYYKNSSFDNTYNGLVSYHGGLFFVSNGLLNTSVNGLCQSEASWYYASNGQVQTGYTGLALYDGEWFYITDGVLDTSKNGLVAYDTGVFLVADGQLKLSYNGLWQNAASIGGDDQWYFIAAGMIQDVSQVVMYDGAFFVVENGVLDSDYNGTVEYDGATFKVVAGQLYS